MKKLIYFLLPVVTGLFVAFHVTAQLETRENLRVIVKFNEMIIPDNTLITQTENIQSETIRELFKRFDVLQLQAVFRNRYNKDGVLKQRTDRNRIPDKLEGWKEIILADKSNASELIDLLRSEEHTSELQSH